MLASEKLTRDIKILIAEMDEFKNLCTKIINELNTITQLTKEFPKQGNIGPNETIGPQESLTITRLTPHLQDLVTKNINSQLYTHMPRFLEYPNKITQDVSEIRDIFNSEVAGSQIEKLFEICQRLNSVLIPPVIKKIETN